MRKTAAFVVGLLFLGGLAGLGLSDGFPGIVIPPIIIPPAILNSRNVTLIADADTYVSEALPRDNFGEEFYLRVGYDNSEFGGLWYSYVWFNLSEIPQDTNVTAAYMCLYLKNQVPANNDLVSAYDVRVAVPGDSWREERVTWNNRPSIAKNVSSLKIDRGVERYYCWDVSNEVKYWVSTPYIGCPTPTCFSIPTNKGFVVYTDDNLATTAFFDFESRENVHPPELIIYYNSSEVLNVTETTETVVNDTMPPTISISEGEGSLDFKYCYVVITDDLAIKSIRIYDNGELLFSEDDYNGTSDRGDHYSKTFQVDGYGNHVIRVVALDYGGNMAEKTLGIHVGEESPPVVLITFQPEHPAIGDLVAIKVIASSLPQRITRMQVYLNSSPDDLQVLEDTPMLQETFNKTYYIRAERGVRAYTVTAYAYDEEDLLTRESRTALVGRCNDMVLNQNEEGVDCGGVCEDCNPYEYGLVSVGYYEPPCEQHDIGDIYYIVHGFGNNLPGTWVKKFDRSWSTAYERMFRDKDYSRWVNNSTVFGEDNLYVDSVDLVFYGGHGGMSNGSIGGVPSWVYTGAFAVKKDSCGILSWWMRFDEDLDWLILYSCHSLENSDGNNQWLEAWNGTFHGLHMIMGFNGVTWISWTTIEIGEDFADNLKDGDTFAQAWLDAATDWACCNKPAVMAVNPYVLDHDHLPGEGEVVYVPNEKADPSRMVWVGYTDCWGLDSC
ncbi:hypothetical protein A3L11_09585 [Thermococcus siculi]|uniref:Carbohydrate-binding module family 96 domain-containing protein n=1 Tax=Thermococcus siculi TaxID=72803 RepID=A0A2Z2MS04_9EURY|nr:DUF6345 domain-containing protein [Thermococcus siculi]ASJ09467.1 hypothetical protein A3L11_09585 [Thermococcus siculi]